MASVIIACFIASVVTLFSGVDGFPSLQAKIPNGNKVPNPCNASGTWPGVGHRNNLGGGALNPFGSDFYANGKVWNRTICEKDSDGDGLSNGYELGDPNCTWVEGMLIANGTKLQHPGICEPLGSSKCAERNSWWTNCSQVKTEFNCPAIKNSGVKNYTMRFTPTVVPTDETTYMCHRFKYPNESTADIIAIEPVIDNAELIHHILLFGCTHEPTGTPDNGAYLCGMGGGVTCPSLIGLWGVGVTGQCLNSQMGFRIGPEGLQYAVMQIHWNNPKHKANLTDSSGMKLYYTTQLRKNRGEIVMIGQNYLEIPPRKDSVEFNGRCSHRCTSELKQSINITSSVLHMHLLGKAGSIHLYRNDKLLTVLEDVDDYDYNDPQMKEFETPIEVRPGDKIAVKCVYDSSDRLTTTYWGEGTSDEMCYAFLSYYPQIEGYTFCGQWKSIDMCDAQMTLHDNCDLNAFMQYTHELPYVCSVDCSNSSSPCAALVTKALATGCQREDDIRSFLKTYMADIGSTLGYCSLAHSEEMMTGMVSRCPPLQGLSYGWILLLIFAFLERLLF